MRASEIVGVHIGRAIVDYPLARQLDQNRDQGDALLGQRIDNLPPVLRWQDGHQGHQTRPNLGGPKGGR